MTTETKLVTAEEFWDIAVRNKYVELVRGEVRQLTPDGRTHGRLQGYIYLFFQRYAEATGGEAGVETGFILQRNPDIVRGPDVYYVGPEQASSPDARGFWPVAPDIAVEVLSPDDRAGEVLEKVQEYLKAGTLAVWVADAPTETITIYFPDGSARVYHVGETIDGGELFPGLSVPLDQVFRKQNSRRSSR